MRVVWSQEARADIRAIYAYRARFSPSGARALLKTIRSRALQLQDFPDSGRIVPEMNNPYMRELIEGDYRIVYERFPDRVEIFAVLDGRAAFQDSNE
ncbi:MAG: type II toxin-antitoxin system RelE/ParE family toxin [Dehalococcoidia bacterium]|nr:type II toxin-antitoxin system RelE/ParE family toxin [Dehalococcoidia bacterium]